MPRPVVGLPDGSRVVTVHQVSGAVKLAGGGIPTYVNLTDLPAADPITAGMLEVRRGRAPAAPDEVALSRDLADRFHVGLGDTLHLEVPAVSYRVVGIVQDANYYNTNEMIVGVFDFDRAEPGGAR